MNDILYQIAMLIVSIVSAVLARYVIPWIKMSIDARTLEQIRGWVESAVLSAQQLMTDSTGQKKKEAVEIFIRQLLSEKGIILTDSQLDTLIEAAVKQMKISEKR